MSKKLSTEIKFNLDLSPLEIVLMSAFLGLVRKFTGDEEEVEVEDEQEE